MSPAARMSDYTIFKSTGDREPFSTEKLERSVQRAGADAALTQEVVHDVAAQKLPTSRAIHRAAFAKLKAKHPPVAARYNLKRALQSLGPSGYPFEQYFARILQAKGYDTSTNRVVRGMCITHEIDVMAYKDERHFVFECKFHNNLGFKSDVQTALYMKARFDDIVARWTQVHEGRGDHHHVLWLVTNTQFTTQAMEYAQCMQIQLMSWRYPSGNSLAELIDETGLHPITAITSLSNHHKDALVAQGAVLCKDLLDRPDALARAGVHGRRKEYILAEARAIVELKDVL